MNHGNYGKIKKKQSESYIVKTLNNFSKYLYHSLIYGFFGKFMTSYISIDNLFDKSLIKLSASREKYSNGESKKKHSAFENSIMVSLFGKFGTHFMRTDFSSYIVFIVSYCLSALVGDILRLYFNNELILLETLKKAAVIFIIITIKIKRKNI